MQLCSFSVTFVLDLERYYNIDSGKICLEFKKARDNKWLTSPRARPKEKTDRGAAPDNESSWSFN